MAYTQKGNAQTQAYKAKAYDRIGLYIPKGRLDDLKAYADKHSTSIQALLVSYIKDSLLRMSESEWKAKPTESLDIDDPSSPLREE